jgi:uncharacterized membrane protein
MMRVTLFTRAGCASCDQVRADLNSLANEFPHRLVEVDIDSDAALHQRYVDKVPVVQAGPYTLNHPFTISDLKVTLAALHDRAAPAPPASIKRDRAIFLNRIVLGLTRHWLALINLLVLLYVGLPFAAPVLMKAGAAAPARVIYATYSHLCHQLGYRSWYLFGEQAAYPSEAAHTSLRTFEEISGLHAYDYWEARDFIGNEQLGYKVALCQRDVAIYGAILLAGLLFSVLRRYIKPIPTWLWFVVGIVPLGLDGSLQLLTSLRIPFLSFLPIYESTPFLRTLTGGLFGLMNAWLAFPYVEESMMETRALVIAKLAGVAPEEASDQ